MIQNYRKPELVAPGGNLEKLKIAAIYGADVVYIGMPGLNLRTRTADFTFDEIGSATEYLHNKGKKIYVALNIFARNNQLAEIKRQIGEISKIPIDALIVSDPGVLSLVKEISPHIPIHLSTQANTTNLLSTQFWLKQGVKRVILARELTIDEIKDINIETGCETEVFVHGAMCMSYSGRCMLSSYMTGRSANLGDCAHSCRWKYSLKEETRPNESFPIIEDEDGTYILSSKDLCMIQFVSELMESGVTAWKIEGRMKSQYYVAAVTRIYREAIDVYSDMIAQNGNQTSFEFKKNWLEELNKVSHRTYSTGFFFGRSGTETGLDADDDNEHNNNGYIRNYRYLGLVEDSFENNMTKIVVKNKIRLGADVEIMGQRVADDFTQRINELYNVNEQPIDNANPGQIAIIKMDRHVDKLSMIREKAE
ncbi:MAG: peptidase U32 family protein [Candidatus Anammoxibacter sp.]